MVGFPFAPSRAMCMTNVHDFKGSSSRSPFILNVHLGRAVFFPFFIGTLQTDYEGS